MKKFNRITTDDETIDLSESDIDEIQSILDNDEDEFERNDQ